MRTTSERVEAIEKRAGERKRRQKKRRNLLAAGLSAAACLVLIVVTALAMPGLMQQQGFASAASGAAAGVFHVSSAAGYVVIGVLAFALGCCVTILCYRLRRRAGEEHDDRDC